MPTRKQKRREAKSKRHDYEFVYLDGEGNELDEVPEELAQPKKSRTPSTNGAAPTKKAPPQRGARGGRIPPVPSWNRALKRGAMLGAVVFAFMTLTSKGSYGKAVLFAFPYTLLFIPFTYYIDRFAYRRWQARKDSVPTPKKR